MNVKLETRNLKLDRGFTLIELLLAATLSIIVATITFVSFSSFNNSQTVNNAALNVATMLQKAKSRAQTQVKPDSITACRTIPISGYEVKFCAISGSGCSSTGVNRYELHLVCGSTRAFVESAQIPSDLSFASGTRSTILFNAITGAAQAGTVIVTGNGRTKTVRVTNTGSITVQ